MASTIERYAFIAEWYDANAALIRKYQFLFYPDNTIEMFDIKNRRLFLKRSKFEGITMKNLYIGAIVNVHSRQLTITDYADQKTRNVLSSTLRTFALIKPDAMCHAGEIIQHIEERQFLINQMRQVTLNSKQAEHFFGSNGMADKPMIAIELMGSDCVVNWKRLIENLRYDCHGSSTEEKAPEEINFFFSPDVRTTIGQEFNATNCIIKPHAIKNGEVGKIMSMITQAGFSMRAIQMFTLSKANAEEFYEIYKGVVNEYSSMVDELCGGQCIAIQVDDGGKSDGREIVTKFRDFVGPSDPEIGRHLRTHTLRAKLGIDKIQNSVHCTDLEEDGELEVNYFFEILQ